MECKLNKFFDNKKEYATLPLRLVVGGILLTMGLMKLLVFTPAGFAGSMLAGFPMAIVFAWIVILTEILGGLALILGFGTRPVAVPVIITMLVAIYMHFFVFTGSSAGFFAAEPAILVLAGATSLLVSGSGKLSLDNVCWKNSEDKPKKK